MSALAQGGAQLAAGLAGGTVPRVPAGGGTVPGAGTVVAAGEGGAVVGTEAGWAEGTDA